MVNVALASVPRTAAVQAIELYVNGSPSKNIQPAKRDEFTDCLYFQGKANSGEYKTVTISKKGTFGLHRLAILAAGDYAGARRMGHTAGLDASHICNKPRCINIEHIKVEDHDYQAGRKTCSKQYILRGYEGSKDMWEPDQAWECVIHAEVECKHEPRCIIPTVWTDKKLKEVISEREKEGVTQWEEYQNEE